MAKCITAAVRGQPVPCLSFQDQHQNMVMMIIVIIAMVTVIMMMMMPTGFLFVFSRATS